MKGGILSLVTINPLPRPTSRENTRQKATTGRTSSSWPSVIPAAKIETEAMTEATDRSIPPVRMTSVSPTARIPNGAACLRIVVRLRGVRKFGETSEAIKTNTPSTIQIAAACSHRRRVSDCARTNCRTRGPEGSGTST